MMRSLLIQSSLLVRMCFRLGGCLQVIIGIDEKLFFKAWSFSREGFKSLAMVFSLFRCLL